jgi:suppressor of ftsI
MQPTVTTLIRLIVAGVVMMAGWGSSVTDWTATDDRGHVAARTTQVAPPGPGNPLREPRQWVSRNGYLRVRLVTEVRQVKLGGRSVRALVYNGDYMPPTIRLRPGDQLDLDLVNKLPEATNLHVHGMHVSPQGNSDNVFLHIASGQTFRYHYNFPLDLAPGTYWYHSHLHGLTEPQVFAGMSGAIVVDGLREYLPPDLQNVKERLIALKDFQVLNGAIPTTNINSNAPTTRTVNGQINPTIGIRPGETQLWRLANIGADIFYRLQLPGRTFHVIAEDANPVSTVWSADSLVLPPGKRYDVLVQGGPSGRNRLLTLAYNQGGDQYPQKTLATVVSTGPAMRPAGLPTAFAPSDDLTRAKVDQRRTIVFSENSAGTAFFINGKQFDPNRIDVRSRLNTVEEWTVRNVTSEQHPFHIHVNDFQVMSVNGAPYHAVGQQDTVVLPIHGEVVIRMRFLDFLGKYVFHCHILNHEDHGMMATIDVVQ